MSEESAMDSRQIWALCRNLDSKKMRALKATDLLEITGANRYRRFAPSHLQDFKSNTDYGYIDGDKLYFHTIFKLSFIEDEIISMARDPRKYGVTAAKRKSITPVVHPAKKFQLEEEKRSSDDDRARKKAASTQHKNDTDRKLLKTFHAKQKSKKQNLASEAPKDGSVDVLQRNKEKRESDTETLNENPQHKEVAVNSDSKSLKRTGVDTEDHPPQKVTKIDAGQPTKISCKGDCAEAVYCKKKWKDAEVRNKILSKEIFEAKEKLKEQESLVSAFTEEKVALKEKLDFAMEQVDALKLAKVAVEESVKNDIQELKATVGKLPGLMGASSSGRTCWASKVESNLSPEEGQISVPDGMVHIGRNLFISKKDITEVEDNQGKFTARLKELCLKIWKGDIKNWSLSGSENGDIKKITVSITKAIVALLRGMDWEEQDLPCFPKQKNEKKSGKVVVSDKPKDSSCITEKVVRLAMRHVLFDIRCKLLTKEEKQALKEKKRVEKKAIKNSKGTPKPKPEKGYGDGDHHSSESERSPIRKASDSEENLKGQCLKSRATSTPLKNQVLNETVNFDFVYDDSNAEEPAGAENATLNSVDDN